jgi:threonine/homoserine/homoserine lactone efflux protein
VDLRDDRIIVSANNSEPETIKFNNLPLLKTPLMLEEYEKKKQKRVSSMRSILDYARGTFFLGIGLLLFFHQKLRIILNEQFAEGAVKLLGVIFALYGVWRIYRGYKKNYFQ